MTQAKFQFNDLISIMTTKISIERFNLTHDSTNFLIKFDLTQPKFQLNNSIVMNSWLNGSVKLFEQIHS